MKIATMMKINTAQLLAATLALKSWERDLSIRVRIHCHLVSVPDRTNSMHKRPGKETNCHPALPVHSHCQGIADLDYAQHKTRSEELVARFFFSCSLLKDSVPSR